MSTSLEDRKERDARQPSSRHMKQMSRTYSKMSIGMLCLRCGAMFITFAKEAIVS